MFSIGARLNEAKDKEAARRARILELEEKFANPYVAAERGFIDEVIEPAQTRPKLIRALSLLENKRDTNPPKKARQHPAVEQATQLTQTTQPQNHLRVEDSVKTRKSHQRQLVDGSDPAYGQVVPQLS